MPFEMLFEAIARPRLFTLKMFRRLMERGAVLSRNLAQLLYVMQLPDSLTGQRDSQWGTSVSFQVYLAVLGEASKLVSHFLRALMTTCNLLTLLAQQYGKIHLEKHRLDSLVFSSELVPGALAVGPAELTACALL